MSHDNTAGSRLAYETRDEGQHHQKLRPRFISVDQARRHINCGRTYFYEEIYPRVKKVKLGKRRTLIDFDSLDEVADSFPAVSAK